MDEDEREARGGTILGSCSCKFTSRNPSRVSGKGQENPLVVLARRGKRAVRTLKQAVSPGERALRLSTGREGSP